MEEQEPDPFLLFPTGTMHPEATQPPLPQPFLGANAGEGKAKSIPGRTGGGRAPAPPWCPGAAWRDDLLDPVYFPLVTLPPRSLPAQDLHKIKACQLAQYKDLTAQKLTESDKLLYVLDGDAAVARHMKHPQGDMITEE